MLSCALVLTLFLFQKGQGFFPPLPIAALLPRSWRWADSNKRCLEYFVVAWMALYHRKAGLSYCPILGNIPTLTVLFRLFRRSMDIPVTQKASVVSNPRWPFYASHEACRRMAVFLIQLTGKLHQTGEPWHLSCHGGKTPANLHISLRPCAPKARSPGCRGSPPARGSAP